MIDDRVRVPVRLVGTDLPGRRFSGRTNVHVGVQRGREVVDPVPGDADRAVFELAVELVTEDGSSVDFRGPYVHGRRGERFLYLSWGERPPDGTFVMFRRAKLPLAAWDEETIRAALAGRPVEGALRLTDSGGGPVCASVRPPAISWRYRGHLV